MKLLFLLIALVPTLALAQPQTNVYYTHIGPESKRSMVCSGTTTTWVDGVGTYVPNRSPIGSNSFYFPDTNIFNLTFSNNLPLIQAYSDFGQIVCGHGSITVTDAAYPADRWRFELDWPTNLPLPNVNSNVPLTTVGVHTNLP